MKFFAITAAFAAVAAAHFSAPVEESCSVVTVTVTQAMPLNTPSAPASHAVTGPAPYPTTVTALSPPAGPVGTGYPSSPVEGGAAKPSGTAAPSGTGAYSAPPSQFTGAASSVKVGGALAVGAFAALFL